MTPPRTRRSVLVVAAAALAGCAGLPGGSSPTATEGDGALTVTSSAFDDGEPIPEPYAKDFRNVNPPLTVEGVPDDAASLALVVDDPDAPGETFVHWLAWNVPADVGTVPEDWDPPEGVRRGTNDFGNVGYDGPRPPGEHTYRFRVYALDVELDLQRGAGRGALDDAIEGSVLARGTLRGTFAPP